MTTIKGLSLLSTLSLVVVIGIKASPEFDLPVARIYQTDSNNKNLRPWTRIENSETIVENVENLRLDCVASYPVQWIYTGNGIPVYTTSNRYSRKNSHGETSSEYSSTLWINPIKEHHTGRYQCSPGEFIDGRTFFHIYVPGSSLFTSLNGHTIILPKNDTTDILIPCTVSNPKAIVTLDKSEGDVLRRVKVKSSDAVTYDPKEGFRLKTDKIDGIEGNYVCSARYGATSKSVEYNIKSYRSLAQSDAPANLKRCSKECGENAYCDIVDGKETCKCNPDFNGDPDLKCVIKCNSHTDCPSTHSCFVDRLCRNPCIHSLVGCGVNAKCRTENHRPVCYCPEGWIGDETVQCFNAWQSSEADKAASAAPGSSKPQSGSGSTGSEDPKLSGVKCGSNTECSYNETCTRFTKESTEKRCLDPCVGRRCGRNAICLTEDHRASCQCLSGFEGDARIECGPIKLEKENKPSFAEPLKDGTKEPESQFPFSRRCDKPDECGPNSQCKMGKSGGQQQCFCKEGYLGQPPKCQPECKGNKDCPEKHVCLADSRVGYPSCSKICGSKVCGAHADCLEFDGGFECYCPEGLYGDPFVRCESKQERIDRDCSVDYDCGIKLRCETGRDYRKCVDPCDKLNCRDEFVCDVDNHVAKCVCPKGYTGNSYVGCNKDVDLSTTVASCANVSCGKNSECRFEEGKPKCFCQNGFIGRPPACIAECFSNSDCPNDLTCVGKRCRHSCAGCGRNTKCRVAPNLSRDSICSCLDGYEGNPYTGCTPLMNG